MSEEQLPTFNELVSEYKDDISDLPTETASLTAALAGSEDDPGKVIEYLTGLGIEVSQLSDLLKINEDEEEEELHAYEVQEGIAVSMASDGLWFLFTE
jgi:hypothetical protein